MSIEKGSSSGLTYLLNIAVRKATSFPPASLADPADFFFFPLPHISLAAAFGLAFFAGAFLGEGFFFAAGLALALVPFFTAAFFFFGGMIDVGGLTGGGKGRGQD